LLLEKIINNSKIFYELDNKGYSINKCTIIKAGVAYLLNNLDIIKKSPKIITRVTSLDETLEILKKIHSLYKEDSKK
jgi:hypothetical protein